MPEITMPRLSDTMEEGTMGRWMKKVGDTVERGEVIAEIESDKATMDFVAYESGVLEKILVKEGETVAVGRPVAVVGSGAAAAAPKQSSDASPAEAAPAAAPPADATEPAPAAGSADGEQKKVKASPLARARARDLGIELNGIRGSGDGGRIVRADVESASQGAGNGAASPVAPPATSPAEPGAGKPSDETETAVAEADVEEIPLSRVRRVAARRLTESMQQTPHFFLTRAVEVDALLTLRSEINGSL
ncbi:MAG: biotin/lipoyl-containing protein, partial [Candidatus Dormibacter sp.]